jgi:hypothetical protein
LRIHPPGNRIAMLVGQMPINLSIQDATVFVAENWQEIRDYPKGILCIFSWQDQGARIGYQASMEAPCSNLSHHPAPAPGRIPASTKFSLPQKMNPRC